MNGLFNHCCAGTFSNYTTLLIVAGLLLNAAPSGAGKPRPAGGDSFLDDFGGYDSTLWTKADGWSNGAPFDNGWQADHVDFEDPGLLTITLDNTPSSGEPYTSGEYRTLSFYGYGCYEARFKPVAESGIVTAFFTFAGPYDRPKFGNGRHNEIDIEFLGSNTSEVQLNFWTDDDSYSNGHEQIIVLDFDASAGFHDYGFKWTDSGIEWYVDGALVHSVTDSPGDPTPKISDTTHRIMLNMWPVDETASGWAGSFSYPGYVLTAQYDWVRFTRGADCTIGEPLPPDPEGNGISVDKITMGLANRNAKATAQITVVDDEGNPVADALVQGEWSGLVTNGDGSKTTNSEGVTPLFYSRRSTQSGEFTFCVTSISSEGYTYIPDGNNETCDSISK